MSRPVLLALCAAVLPLSAHAQTDQTVPTGKLPDTAAPTAYRLDLTVLPSHERFSGHAEVDVDVKHATPMLYMHGRDLNVTKATATIAGKTFPVTLKQVTPLGLDRLDFGRTVQPGKVTLKFDYDAAFASAPAGLYRIEAGDTWYSWTQFESIDARAAFPSFDEPGFKTPFTVTLTTKPGFTALSNAPEVDSRKVGDLVQHRFEATKPLPTYLVAFVVGPFATTDTAAAPTDLRGKPLPIRIVGTQVNKDKLGFAKENSGPIVDLLENYFGEPFPFPKLDQIGSPVMPGAMENAGADIYGDDILLLDPDATTTDKQTFGMVVAHELSHQWFGDLVTPAWWDDIWLNESFANWMGYRIGSEWRPDLNIGAGATAEAFEAMNLDALKAGRPIHQKITSDADINSAFDAITYGKGGQVVKMIAAYMGDEQFQKGVRLHLKRHAYGNATTDQFFQSLADAAGDPRVLTAMRSFVDQQGVPLVTIRRDGDKLTASQSRYSYLGTDLAPESWTIPFCVRRGDAKDCSLLGDKPETISLKGGGLLMPNAGGNGYYRFEVDPADWDALITAAPTLSADEGLALEDSLWASFSAGRASPQRLIALTRAAAKNSDSNVAVESAQRMGDFAGRGIIPDRALPAYRKLIDDIYSPLLDELQFDPARVDFDGDTPDRQKLRISVVRMLANDADDSVVRDLIEEAAKAYVGGDKDALAPAYVHTGLSLLVADNDLAYAQALADKALSGDDDNFRSAALGAIAGSGRSDVANWLLNDFHDPRLRQTERIGLAQGLAGNAATRSLALTYLLGNFDSIAKNAGIFAARRIPGMFEGSCTLEDADKLDQALRAKVAAAGVSMLSFDRTIETIRTCAHIREARSDDLAKALMSSK